MSNQIHESIPNQLNLPFELIFDWLGIGEPVPSQSQMIAHLPLIILVGVTAAGKNTATAAMQELGIEFTLLPNRRELSDLITIPLMMGISRKADSAQVKKLDRVERLNYTRQFRQKYPGGMAQVIAKMSVDTRLTPHLLVFDGLRGAAEVGYAATNLPQAKFMVLEAPDQVRLLRLLNRNDPFDRASTSASKDPNQKSAQITGQITSNTNQKPSASGLISPEDHQSLPDSFESLGIPDAALIFAPDQEQEILQLLRNGQIEVNQLRDKLRIIIAERQNYDPIAARNKLMAIAPERSLFINTSTTPPDRIAELIKNYLD